jgi:polar amino acid transport system substrate-binding protein
MPPNLFTRSTIPARWVWIAAAGVVIILCLCGAAISIILYFRSDSNLPTVNRPRPTNTHERADSPHATPTCHSTGIPEPTSFPLEMPPTVAPFPAGRTLTVVTDATWPPFEYLDANGKLVGFDIDMMNAIADRAGFEVEYINVSFDEVLAGLVSCEYPAAISGITITPERQQSMLFSDPYFNDGQVIVARADDPSITDLDSLAGKRIAILVGTNAENITSGIPGAIVSTFDDPSSGYDALYASEMNAVITFYSNALQVVGTSAGELVIIGEPMTAEMFGIAICNQSIEWLAPINTALAQLISEGSLELLTQTWLSNPNQ